MPDETTNDGESRDQVLEPGLEVEPLAIKEDENGNEVFDSESKTASIDNTADQVNRATPNMVDLDTGEFEKTPNVADVGEEVAEGRREVDAGEM